MLTVDKSLEKLRRDHESKSGSSKKNGFLRSSASSSSKQSTGAVVGSAPHSGASLENVRATCVTMYEPATIATTKVSRASRLLPGLSFFSKNTSGGQDKGTGGGTRHPRRTKSERSEAALYLPPNSGTDSPIIFDEDDSPLTQGYHASSGSISMVASSAAVTCVSSPHMSQRGKINQSRKNFFQSLLPTTTTPQSSTNQQTKQQHDKQTTQPKDP